MIENILPLAIKEAVEKLEYDKLCELRIRCGSPVKAFYGDRFYYLSKDGVTTDCKKSLLSCGQDIEYILLKVCKHSVYAVSERLADGFITSDSGIRIGVCGKVVRCGERINTIKDVGSLVIRLPHTVDGCSDEVINVIMSRGTIRNTLIASPPGGGKTTFLKDIIKRICMTFPFLNILVLDERGEFSALDIDGCDVMSYCDKAAALRMGIRALRPDIAICDEIGTDDDVAAIESATVMGVKIIATAHAESIGDIFSSKRLGECAKQFDRIAVLSGKPRTGTVMGIYDGSGRQIRY